MIFSLTVAACEAAIALALVLMLYHRNGKLDIDAWHELRESNLPPYTDVELPEVRETPKHWPHLTPAGVEPPAEPEERTASGAGVRGSRERGVGSGEQETRVWRWKRSLPVPGARG